MSMTVTPSLLELPVELIYRILDQLDANDRLFSFRNVCTQLYALVNNYDRLTIDFAIEKSKADIQRMCRIIRFENVVSFTLSYAWDDTSVETGSVDIPVDIHQFTRLRSLNLSCINEADLKTIMNYLTTISTLTSLSINMYANRSLNNDTIALLSRVIALPRLRKLSLYDYTGIINEIS